MSLGPSRAQLGGGVIKGAEVGPFRGSKEKKGIRTSVILWKFFGFCERGILAEVFWWPYGGL